MFMGDVEHDSEVDESGALNASTAANLSLQWTFASGGTIASEPTVANDRVEFGSWDGDEYSLLASNGSLQWATSTGQSQCLPGKPYIGVTSSATLTESALYFGGGSDEWEALSPSNGSLLWQLYTGNSSTGKGNGYYNWASPLIYGKDAYIGLSSHCDYPLVQGQLLKVSLKSHTVVGEFNTTPRKYLGATIWSSPAVNPATGTIFFATGNLYAGQGTNATLDDSIVAINASTMAYQSHFQVPYAQRISDGDFGASVTLFPSDTGTPLVGDDNKDGYYFALNQSNLSAGPLWTDNISSQNTYSSAAYAHGDLFVGSARTTTAKGKAIAGSLRSLNATTGHVNWELPLPGKVYGPVVVDDDVVVAAGGPDVVVVKASDGMVLYNFTTASNVLGGPAVAAGRIFIGDVYGNLYSLGLPLSAGARSNITSGPAPLTAAFLGSGFGGAPVYTYSWNFGDGKHSVLEDPVHVFHKPGTYSVVLTLRDRAGVAAMFTIMVVVTEPAQRRRPPG
jgi:polyvinyl alcohol dehydrogenase (cytochrome)